jgi:hypothetical protein
MNENWILRCGRGIAPVLISSLMVGQMACSGSPTGGSAGDETRGATSQTSAASYDGEALLRGLYFGNGPAAELLGSPAKAPAPSLDPRLATGNLLSTLQTARTSLAAQGQTEAVARIDAIRDEIASGHVSDAQIRAELDSVDPNLIAGNVADLFIDSVRTSDPTFLSHFEAEMKSGDPVRVSAAIDDGSKRVVEFTNRFGGAGNTKIARPEVLVLILVIAIAFLWVVPAPVAQDVPRDGLSRDERINDLTLRLAH